MPGPAAPSTLSPPQRAAVLRPRDQFAEVGRCHSTGRTIRLCYNTFGAAKDPCVLLVMGLASPGLFWDDRLCTLLAHSGPYHVIRFDNRDVGCSTHLDDCKGSDGALPVGPASYLRYAYAALRPGTRSIREVYTLNDMAADAFGLLDVLRIRFVHLVGSSAGGMIAQCMVLAHPERVLSLTLMSTHSSSPHAQWPGIRDIMSLISLVPKSTSARYASRIARATSAEERQRLCAERDAERVTAYAASFTKLLEKMSGDRGKYPFDHVAAQRQMTRIFKRSLCVTGGPRQFLALLNAPCRDDALRQRITSVAPISQSKAGGNKNISRHATSAVTTPFYVPTIIIQGDCDPLVPASNARHLASVIAGSRLYVVEGMGHTLIPALRGTYIQIIRDNVRAGEAAAQSLGRKAQQTAAAAADGGLSAKKQPVKAASRL
ncbi:Alpha/beta hydrolase family protein [Leishmania donovani]|uniref:Alpha/beta hydrolase family protein n=1 Tax=Leishmania donovani TaxID=5661 RepID=A0A504Y308_LEIDO|nr:Alpha/beta hydrolase family protein [Leishmania donovani]